MSKGKDFFVSKSDDDNVEIADQVLQQIVGLNRNRSVVVGLSGELGAGKTTFTRGLVSALGGDPDQVASPTYVLMKDYELGENIYQLKTLEHLDVYRLKNTSELDTLKLADVLQNPNTIFVIEWWDKFKTAFKKLAPKMTILEFETINDYTRTITVK